MLYIDSIQNLLVSEYLDPCLQFARPRQHLDPERGAVWETFRKMPNSCLNDQLSSLIWCYVMPDTNWILAETKICELDWIGMSKIVTRTLIVQTAAPREVPLFQPCKTEIHRIFLHFTRTPVQKTHIMTQTGQWTPRNFPDVFLGTHMWVWWHDRCIYWRSAQCLSVVCNFLLVGWQGCCWTHNPKPRIYPLVI